MGKKDLKTEKTKDNAHVVIPVKREVDRNELMNLVASFICSHEGIPAEKASVGQEGNNFVVQVYRELTNTGKKKKILYIETFTVQFSFRPETCIVDFSWNKRTPGDATPDSTLGIATIAGAAVVGVVFAPAVVLGSIAVGGAVGALSSSSEKKRRQQLKDNVFALIYDYFGYDPKTQTEGIDAENINTIENKTAETVAQICECGYVFSQKMQFCPECGKKVVEPVEKKCECGYVISEGVKFCPQCGKSVSQ